MNNNVYIPSVQAPGGQVLSRLEQHERMLAERERERREQQRLVSLGRAPSRGEISRPRYSRDIPLYGHGLTACLQERHRDRE